MPCKNARDIVITDDSTYINKRRLEVLARKEMYSSNRIYSSFLFNMRPNRDSAKGDHFISNEDWPWPHFPTFAGVGSYVVSSEVIPRLLLAASSVPNLRLPKVYLSGLLPLLLDVIMVDINGFFLKHVSDDVVDSEPHRLSDNCTVAKAGFVEGISSPEEILQIHDMVEDMHSRNVTCAGRKCLAKLDGKCMFYAPKIKS